MKGLLIKDFYLLKNQLNFFLIVGAIGILMMFTQNNSMFIISYLTFIFSMFTLSTISYDEFDNGAAFLFTLPISRTTYVQEKYCFGFLTAALTWAVVSVAAGIYTVVRQPETKLLEWILSAILLLCIPLVFLALTIPVQLKFGSEKSRIAMFAVVGGVTVLVFAVLYIVKVMGIPVGKILDELSAAGSAGFLGIIVILTILLCTVSYGISLKIMKKKEL